MSRCTSRPPKQPKSTSTDPILDKIFSDLELGSINLRIVGPGDPPAPESESNTNPIATERLEVIYRVLPTLQIPLGTDDEPVWVTDWLIEQYGSCTREELRTYLALYSAWHDKPWNEELIQEAIAYVYDATDRSDPKQSTDGDPPDPPPKDPNNNPDDDHTGPFVRWQKCLKAKKITAVDSIWAELANLYHRLAKQRNDTIEQQTLVQLYWKYEARVEIADALLEMDPRLASWITPAHDQLSGQSILAYAEASIDREQNILGIRWLERGQGGFIFAPTGHGKSTVSIQSAIHWSCGTAGFGIPIPRALKILIVESEDNRNDNIEICHMLKRMGLTKEQCALVDANSHIEWVNDLTGQEFTQALDRWLEKFAILKGGPADLVMINPYSAYLGGDTKDEKLANQFLRNWLSPVLAKHRCAGLLITHSPKTIHQKTDDFQNWEWVYAMAGSAAMANWARACLAVWPAGPEGTYRFIAAKRWQKIGWQGQTELWFSHSSEILQDKDGNEITVPLWNPATEAQILAGKKTTMLEPKDLLPLIPIVESIGQNELEEAYRKAGHKNATRLRKLRNTLIEQNKVFEWQIPRPPLKPAIRYSQSPQPEEPPAQPPSSPAKPEDLLAVIPPNDPISQDRLRYIAKAEFRLSRTQADQFANILVDEKKIFVHSVQRKGKSSGIGYAQQPPPQPLLEFQAPREVQPSQEPSTTRTEGVGKKSFAEKYPDSILASPFSEEGVTELDITDWIRRLQKLGLTITQRTLRRRIQKPGSPFQRTVRGKYQFIESP
jgi:AAA domain-containing protein